MIVHLVRVLILAPQIFGKVYALLTLSAKIEAGDSSYDTVLLEIVSNNADDRTAVIREWMPGALYLCTCSCEQSALTRNR